MSSTSSASQYNFNISILTGNYMDNGTLQFSSNTGMTDAMAFSLVDAIKNLGWPTGAHVQVDLFKQDITDVAYTTNYTSTPPSFT